VGECRYKSKGLTQYSINKQLPSE